jgi:hypothetical protein
MNLQCAVMVIRLLVAFPLRAGLGRRGLLRENVATNANALVADMNSLRASDELPHLTVRLCAERTGKRSQNDRARLAKPGAARVGSKAHLRLASVASST